MRVAVLQAAVKVTPSKRKKNDDDEEYDPCSSLISPDGETMRRDKKEIAKVCSFTKAALICPPKTC